MSRVVSEKLGAVKSTLYETALGESLPCLNLFVIWGRFTEATRSDLPATVAICAR